MWDITAVYPQRLVREVVGNWRTLGGGRGDSSEKAKGRGGLDSEGVGMGVGGLPGVWCGCRWPMENRQKKKS